MQDSTKGRLHGGAPKIGSPLGESGHAQDDVPTSSRADVHVIFTDLESDRGLAHNATSIAEPVLAAFDTETAAVWGNEALARAIRRFQHTGRRLGDQDVETLVHEFARVSDYEDLFEEHASQSARAKAMCLRLSISVSRATEESFANRMLMREHQAEELVRRIQLEILSSFDRSQRGIGFREYEINRRAEGLATEWMDGHRGEYLQKARRQYRRTLALRDNADGYASLMQNPGLEQVYVKPVARMFPTDQSPLLAQLIERMTRYDMSFVVPLLD